MMFIYSKLFICIEELLEPSSVQIFSSFRLVQKSHVELYFK